MARRYNYLKTIFAVLLLSNYISGHALSWTVKFDNTDAQWENVYIQVLSTDSMYYPMEIDWRGRLMDSSDAPNLLTVSFEWEDSFDKCLVGFGNKPFTMPATKKFPVSHSERPLMFSPDVFYGAEYSFSFDDRNNWNEKGGVGITVFDANVPIKRPDISSFAAGKTLITSDDDMPGIFNCRFYSTQSFSQPTVMVYDAAVPSNHVTAPFTDDMSLEPVGDDAEISVFLDKFPSRKLYPMQYINGEYRIDFEAKDPSESGFHICTPVQTASRAAGNYTYIYPDEWPASLASLTLDLEKMYTFSGHDISRSSSSRTNPHGFGSFDSFIPQTYAARLSFSDPEYTSGEFGVGPEGWGLKAPQPTSVKFESIIKTTDAEYYTIDGRRITSTENLTPDIYILHHPSGSTSKLLVR